MGCPTIDVDVEEIRECLLEIRDIVESGGGGGEDDVVSTPSLQSYAVAE